VVAIFREARAHGRLLLLVEAESLFNDGTAAVAFGAVVAWALGHSPTPIEMTATILMMVGGGLLCGAAVGGAMLLLAGPHRGPSRRDHLHDRSRLWILPSGGAFPRVRRVGYADGRADDGESRPPRLDLRPWKEAVQAFWDYAAFVANSLVFLLIGMHEARQDFAAVWLPAAAAILLVLLGRAAAIYPAVPVFVVCSSRILAASAPLSGRIARRAGARPGAWAPAGSAAHGNPSSP